MSTAYIVQEPLKRDAASGALVPRINYRTLKPYGELRILFQWDELKDGDQPDARALCERLRDLLCNFSDKDYIVPLGNPALIALAVMIAAECNDGKVRMLDWIKEEKRYRIIPVDLDWEAA